MILRQISLPQEFCPQIIFLSKRQVLINVPRDYMKSWCKATKWKHAFSSEAIQHFMLFRGNTTFYVIWRQYSFFKSFLLDLSRLNLTDSRLNHSIKLGNNTCLNHAVCVSMCVHRFMMLLWVRQQRFRQWLHVVSQHNVVYFTLEVNPGLAKLIYHDVITDLVLPHTLQFSKTPRFNL